MSQVRFQIGVPRMSDAARSAEEAYSSAEDGGWTRAKKVALSGSAARAVEEQKRAEGVAAKQGKAIAFRATGGAVVDRETMIRHSTAPEQDHLQESSSRENSVIAEDFPVIERITPSRTVSSDYVRTAAENGAPKRRINDTSVSTGLLQSAAARIQSLTRSLFHREHANR